MSDATDTRPNLLCYISAALLILAACVAAVVVWIIVSAAIHSSSSGMVVFHLPSDAGGYANAACEGVVLGQYRSVARSFTFIYDIDDTAAFAVFAEKSWLNAGMYSQRQPVTRATAPAIKHLLMNVAFTLWSDSVRNRGVWRGPTAELNASIATAQSDPRVIGYYTFDEPSNPLNNVSAAYQEAAYRYLKQVDPGRLVVIANPFWWWFEGGGTNPTYTRNSYDVLFFDVYSTNADTIMQQYRLAMQNGFITAAKPVVPILPAFDSYTVYEPMCRTLQVLRTFDTSLLTVFGFGFFTWHNDAVTPDLHNSTFLQTQLVQTMRNLLLGGNTTVA